MLKINTKIVFGSFSAVEVRKSRIELIDVQLVMSMTFLDAGILKMSEIDEKSKESMKCGWIFFSFLDDLCF